MQEQIFVKTKAFLFIVFTKNLDAINELSDKLNKVEVQKSKLEIKAKEVMLSNKWNDFIIRGRDV